MAVNRWTYEEYYRLKDGKRHEILEGVMYLTPAPSLLHQEASKIIEYILMTEIELNDKGTVFDAPVDVVLADDIVLQPDLVVVLEQNSSILQEKCIMGAPDVVIEILSPSSMSIDVRKKYDLYERFGVKEYWLINPGFQSATVYSLKDGKYELESEAFERDDIVRSPLLGVNISLRDIFKRKREDV